MAKTKYNLKDLCNCAVQNTKRTLNLSGKVNVAWGVDDLDGGINYFSNPTKFHPGESNFLQEPTKPGMMFAGWTWTSASKSMPDPWYLVDTMVKDEEGKIDPAKTFPDEDVILKAHWALPRTITVHGNGGLYINSDSTTSADHSYTFPDVPDAKLMCYITDDQRKIITGIRARGKNFDYDSLAFAYNTSLWRNASHRIYSLKDNIGNTYFEDLAVPQLPSDHEEYGYTMPPGVTDFNLQWKLSRKYIRLYPDDPPTHVGHMFHIAYTNPDGSKASSHFGPIRPLLEYTGKQWDESSPNVTFSLKGHETGSPNEYVLDDFEEVPPILGVEKGIGYLYQSFSITVAPGSSHTYPTGNLTSYTFTGGFDQDIVLHLHSVRAWKLQYLNLDDTPITTMQTLKEADLPYTFRNTYPPHAPWHGFPVIPVGWTLGKYNQGSPDAEGVYTSTGNLPTLFKGTFDAATFNTVQPILKLYPMYSVDVNKDGIPDLFQNKNTLTVSKEVVKGQYTDLTGFANKIFPYEITFKDVHG